MIDVDDGFVKASKLAAGVRPPVDKEMALSLKFDVVSCSCLAGICNVVVVVVVVVVVAVVDVDEDGRDNKCLVSSDEIRLINASSSFVERGDDVNGEDKKGCSTTIFVGVFGSTSTVFTSGKLLA